MSGHLDMMQLLALRDSDRSEPGMAEAQRHFAACAECQRELERLHQRTARLRALPTLEPGSNEYPAVQVRVRIEQRQRRWRTGGLVTMAAAAAIVITLIGRDLVLPPRLDASEQLQSAISRSQQLEQQLHYMAPDSGVIDGRTVMVVVQLEDRIAALDAQLAQSARLEEKARVTRQLDLWRERVGLMNALVDVHLTNASNVGL